MPNKAVKLNSCAFLGDIHCGSVVGLWPVEDLPSNKFKGIRYLMECYNDLIDSWPKLDLLVLTGDLIDGKQDKSRGVGVITTDLGEQAEAAALILKKAAAKAKKVYRVWGTPYHESHDSILKIVDKSLGVEHIEQVIDLETGSGILNVAHHPASGSTLYQGTSTDKEAIWSEISCFENKTPNARFIVRAHKHSYILQETSHRTICILPCFQLSTTWANKQNYWRFQPSLGGVLMISDDLHHSGYRFIPKLYPLPKKEIKKWEN